MATKKVVKSKKKDGSFSVSLKINGLEYKSSSETLEEAILGLPTVKPKTKGIITVFKDGKESKPIILAITALNRLFYPGMTGSINRTVFRKRYEFFA